MRWEAAWLVLAVCFARASLGADAEGSSSCGSGSGMDPCPTPEPTSHLQTLLMWDCDGRIRILPDNPVFNVNIDMPALPRLFNSLMDGLKEYVQRHCINQQESVSSEEFSRRYHPVNAFLYGNALYKEEPVTNNPCLDGMPQFTRDLLKVFDALTSGSSFEMPASCPHYYWEREDKLKCSFVHELMEFDAQLQVYARKCSANQHFFELYIGCQGEGCSVMKPCRGDEDCGAKDHLACTDPFNWVDPKVLGEQKFTEGDVYDWLRDNMFFYQNDRNNTNEECKDHRPTNIFASFVRKFGKQFVHSAEYAGKSSCDASDTCKICLPVHTNAFESTVTEFPGRWKEVSDDYPKDRYKYDEDGCGHSAARLRSNISRFVKEPSAPTILKPMRPTGLYTGYVTQFGMDSPLVMGAKLYIEKTATKIGGAPCLDHGVCAGATGKRGLCLTDVEFCAIAKGECDRQGICEWDSTGTNCVPMFSTGLNGSACACFAVEKTDPDAAGTQLVYGDTCGQSKYISEVDEDNILDLIYTDEIHKWRARYDPFIAWDGYYAADGISPFALRDHWARFPLMRAPAEETHLASIQCDGVIHLFMKTPYATRVYLPMAPKLLDWLGNTGQAIWECRDKNVIKGNTVLVNTERYTLAQAFWRPEVWLYGKVADRAPAENAPPGGFTTSFVEYLFPKSTLGVRSSTFDMWSYVQMVRFSDSFTLFDWFSSGYVGTTLTTLNQIANQVGLGADFALNVRAEQCPDFPMGLAKVDLTCQGKACEWNQYSTPCVGNSDCTLPATCRDPLATLVDSDVVSQLLWGVERPSTGAYTDDSFCPALETYGTQGSTTKVSDKIPVRLMMYKLWQAVRYADCPSRSEGDCWGHCTWKGACTYTEAGPPPFSPTGGSLKFCMPPVYPSFSDTTYFDMLVTAFGKATAVQAGLYTMSESMEHEGQSNTQIFDFTATAAALPKAETEDTESVYKPTGEDNTPTFGTSFIVVMLCMGVIICVSSACVWYHYIRKSSAEIERESGLHELTFASASKPTQATYGRDLMIPDMCKRWLPQVDQNGKPGSPLMNTGGVENENKGLSDAEVLLSPPNASEVQDAYSSSPQVIDMNESPAREMSPRSSPRAREAEPFMATITPIDQGDNFSVADSIGAYSAGDRRKSQGSRHPSAYQSPVAQSPPNGDWAGIMSGKKAKGPHRANSRPSNYSFPD
ncbi:hypothetical protein DIPPA_22744 [Diplonema papillatum]|nr:hypothetical protein DIPPA_22744 [Diplonema papillatum]